MTRCAWLVALAIAGFGFFSPPVLAASLPKEDCDQLKAEEAQLAAAGAKDHLGRGADWGKANLKPEQMQRVERYIAVDEQLAFRCGLAQLRASLPMVEEGGEQELDEKGQPIPPKEKKGTPAAAAKPKAKTPVPKTAAKAPAPSKDGSPPAAAKSNAPAKTAAGRGAVKPAAAKAKPKAKADDAYRPPSPRDPKADPFAGRTPAQTKP